MPFYQYWAKTEIGDVVTGRLAAASPDDAAHLLTLRGLVAQRLEEVAEPAPEASEPAAATIDEDAPADSGRREQFPLTTSLRVLAEEAPRRRMRQALLSVIARLEQGVPLEQSLGSLQAAFPRRVAPVIEVGVQTGRLPYLMQHTLDQLRRAAELRRSLWLNLAYPALMALMALVLTAGILVFTASPFIQIFRDWGVQIPILTQIVLYVAEAGQFAFSGLRDFLFRRDGWQVFVVPVVVAAAVGAWIALRTVFQLRSVRIGWHRFLTWIPLIGSGLRSASLSGFFRMLATLVDCNVPLPSAFRIAAAVADDASLSAHIDDMSRDLEHGTPPLDAVRVSEAVPREALPMFRWADNRPLFVEALRGAADIYAARSQLFANLVAVILEPVLLLMIGSMVTVVIFALFLPLIKLLNDLA